MACSMLQAEMESASFVDGFFWVAIIVGLIMAGGEK